MSSFIGDWWNTMETLSDVLEELENRGVPRKQLALWGGVDPRTVNYWMEGRSEPSWDVLRRLLTRGDEQTRAAILGCLMRGTGMQAVPVEQVSSGESVKLVAQLAMETAEVVADIANGAAVERVESDVADVIRLAGQVRAGATSSPLRLSRNG